jgi:hypothetical protein
MMLIGIALAGALLGLSAAAQAQYVFELRNGRQIHVQSYREEGSMLKFYGFGGEIGISKNHVRAIRKATDAPAAGLAIPGAAPASSATSDAGPLPAPAEEKAEKTPTPEELRAQEAKDYHQKLIEVTDKLNQVQAGFSQSVRGTTNSDPNLQWSGDQRGATQDDVIGRFRSAASNPSEPAPVNLLTPSPFSSLPPSSVEVQPAQRAPVHVGAQQLPETQRQRDLTDLRGQMIQLEKERDRLIDEMKEKKLDTGKILR